MSKAFKETTKVEKYLGPVLMGIILIVFTLFGFVFKQECDIDKVYLWCRLHPLSVFDIIGLIGFYGAGIIVSGATPLKLFNPENSVKWNLISFAVLVLSAVIIWNL